jgi:hypothetical protein
VITILGEVMSGPPWTPAVPDLVRWAEMSQDDLTFPVLSDHNWEVSTRFERDFGIPTYSLIGRDMELLVVDDPVSTSDIETALEAPVPEVEWDVPPALGNGDGETRDNSSENGAFGGCVASLGGADLPSPGAWITLLLGLVLLRRRLR